MILTFSQNTANVVVQTQTSARLGETIKVMVHYRIGFFTKRLMQIKFDIKYFRGGSSLFKQCNNLKSINVSGLDNGLYILKMDKNSHI